MGPAPDLVGARGGVGRRIGGAAPLALRAECWRHIRVGLLTACPVCRPILEESPQCLGRSESLQAQRGRSRNRRVQRQSSRRFPDLRPCDHQPPPPVSRPRGRSGVRRARPRFPLALRHPTPRWRTQRRGHRRDYPLAVAAAKWIQVAPIGPCKRSTGRGSIDTARFYPDSANATLNPFTTMIHRLGGMTLTEISLCSGRILVPGHSTAQTKPRGASRISRSRGRVADAERPTRPASRWALQRGPEGRNRTTVSTLRMGCDITHRRWPGRWP